MDPKYTYSRNACLNAARRTLQHHSDVYQESLPGGQLYAERFFMNSFQNTDFMLSAMILCLELSQETERDRTQMSPQERDDLLQLLETTYKIFREGRHRSSDTHRGYVALRIMLGRVRGSPVQSGSSMSDEQIVQVDSKSIILFISSYPTETNLVRRSIDIPTGASFNRSAAISDVYIEQRGPADCRLCLRRSAVSLITRSD